MSVEGGETASVGFDRAAQMALQRDPRLVRFVGHEMPKDRQVLCQQGFDLIGALMALEAKEHDKRRADGQRDKLNGETPTLPDPPAQAGEGFRPILKACCSFTRLKAPAAYVTSAPPQGGRDVGQNRLYDMGVVGDAELIGDRQQQSVGFGDRLVRL